MADRPQPLTDVSRWRAGHRDDAARGAHNADTTSWRRGIAEARFGPDGQAVFLQAVRDGKSVRLAAAVVGMTPQGIYGRATWDHGFRDTLEPVLAETCPAGDYCGGPMGYKFGGHCRACRDAHPR